MPRVDAIAGLDASGKLWLEVTNLDPQQPLVVEASGIAGRSASGQTLTAPKVDSVNSFDAPHMVAPKPANVKLQGGQLTLNVEPKSVTVISIEE